MFHVREINDFDELRQLRPVWDRLWQETVGATFFHSFQWLETNWEYFGNGRQLRVLVVESSGTPIGILPLMVASERRRIGPVRVLTYPLEGWGSFYGPIGPQPTETLYRGLKHIQETPRDWDLLDLRWVDATGDDHGQTPHAMQLAGFDYDARIWHQSAQIELDLGWDAYWKSRKSRWRNNVRRCERKLAERGELVHLRYRPRGEKFNETDPRWDLYEACVEIARRSWQGSSTAGTTLSHENVRAYLRAAHATAVKSGTVDLNLLLLADTPVAFAYNYHYRGWVYGLRSGYDREAVQEGAGTVLMKLMIEDSCRRGDVLHDLGPEYLECKRYWLTRLRPAYHYTHFRPTGLRAQVLRAKRTVTRWLGWGALPKDSAKYFSTVD